MLPPGSPFSTDADHQLWMRLADDGSDKASRDRGRGYRDGLAACGIAENYGGATGSARAQQRSSQTTTRRSYTTER